LKNVCFFIGPAFTVHYKTCITKHILYILAPLIRSILPQGSGKLTNACSQISLNVNYPPSIAAHRACDWPLSVEYHRLVELKLLNGNLEPRNEHRNLPHTHAQTTFSGHFSVTLSRLPCDILSSFVHHHAACHDTSKLYTYCFTPSHHSSSAQKPN